MSDKHVRNVRGVRILKKQHKAIKKIQEEKDAPEIHGDKVWFSSYFVMDYLLENPLKRKSNIMEIGCGWGILSVFCAQHYKGTIVGVDADKNVFPFLQAHARENNVKIKRKVAKYQNLRSKTLQQQDAIVGADICFWKELKEPLYMLIKKALKNGVKTIIIGDPGRSPFLKLASKCQKKFNAELLDVSIDEPNQKEGYLLVIKNG